MGIQDEQCQAAPEPNDSSVLPQNGDKSNGRTFQNIPTSTCSEGNTAGSVTAGKDKYMNIPSARQ